MYVFCAGRSHQNFGFLSVYILPSSKSLHFLVCVPWCGFVCASYDWLVRLCVACFREVERPVRLESKQQPWCCLYFVCILMWLRRCSSSSSSLLRDLVPRFVRGIFFPSVVFRSRRCLSFHRGAQIQVVPKLVPEIDPCFPLHHHACMGVCAGGLRPTLSMSMRVWVFGK